MLYFVIKSSRVLILFLFHVCFVLFSFFVRLSMSPDEHSEFWRKVQFTVDKDVVRTDRSNHFFRGENNPNVEIMRSENIFSFFLKPLIQSPLLLPSLGPSPSLPFLSSSTAVPTVLISYSEPLGEPQMSFMLYWLWLSRVSTFDAYSELMAF